MPEPKPLEQQLKAVREAQFQAVVSGREQWLKGLRELEATIVTEMHRTPDKCGCPACATRREEWR